MFMVIVVKHCIGVEREQSAAKDGLVRYDFSLGEVCRVDEKSVK